MPPAPAVLSPGRGLPSPLLLSSGALLWPSPSHPLPKGHRVHRAKRMCPLESPPHFHTCAPGIPHPRSPSLLPALSLSAVSPPGCALRLGGQRVAVVEVSTEPVCRCSCHSRRDGAEGRVGRQVGHTWAQGHGQTFPITCSAQNSKEWEVLDSNLVSRFFQRCTSQGKRIGCVLFNNKLVLY